MLEVVVETPRARTLVLDVPEWPGHRAGQHVDIRVDGVVQPRPHTKFS